jgi:hypothetical protein
MLLARAISKPWHLAVKIVEINLQFPIETPVKPI